MSSITDLDRGRMEELAELPHRDAETLSAGALVNRLVVTSGLLLHQLESLLRAGGLTAGSYNVLLVIDLRTGAAVDLSVWRMIPAVLGAGALLYALVWETQ